MKVISVEEKKYFYVKTDEEEYNEYQRESSGGWLRWMGNTLEEAYDDGTLETAFQEFVLSKRVDARKQKLIKHILEAGASGNLKEKLEGLIDDAIDGHPSWIEQEEQRLGKDLSKQGVDGIMFGSPESKGNGPIIDQNPPTIAQMQNMALTPTIEQVLDKRCWDVSANPLKDFVDFCVDNGVDNGIHEMMDKFLKKQ